MIIYSKLCARNGGLQDFFSRENIRTNHNVQRFFAVNANINKAVVTAGIGAVQFVVALFIRSAAACTNENIGSFLYFNAVIHMEVSGKYVTHFVFLYKSRECVGIFFEETAVPSRDASGRLMKKYDSLATRIFNLFFKP